MLIAIYKSQCIIIIIIINIITLISFLQHFVLKFFKESSKKINFWSFNINICTLNAIYSSSTVHDELPSLIVKELKVVASLHIHLVFCVIWWKTFRLVRWSWDLSHQICHVMSLVLHSMRRHLEFHYYISHYCCHVSKKGFKTLWTDGF